MFDTGHTLEAGCNTKEFPLSVRDHAARMLDTTARLIVSQRLKPCTSERDIEACQKQNIHALMIAYCDVVMNRNKNPLEGVRSVVQRSFAAHSERAACRSPNPEYPSTM
jgi:hypothetical protein